MVDQLSYGGALRLPAPRNTLPRPTVDRARVERDAANESVADKAGAEWAVLALNFLTAYARHHALFTPEDVTDAMVKAGGPQPGAFPVGGQWNPTLAGLQWARRTECINSRHWETVKSRSKRRSGGSPAEGR